MMFFQHEKPRPNKKNRVLFGNAVFFGAACKDRIISYQGLGGSHICQLLLVGSLIFCCQRKSNLIFDASIYMYIYLYICIFLHMQLHATPTFQVKTASD